jgi:hypothetical protein
MKGEKKGQIVVLNKTMRKPSNIQMYINAIPTDPTLDMISEYGNFDARQNTSHKQSTSHPIMISSDRPLQ